MMYSRCAVDYQQKSGPMQACFGQESLIQKGGLLTMYPLSVKNILKT